MHNIERGCWKHIKKIPYIFIHLFIDGQVGLLPTFGYYDSAAMDMDVQISLWDFSFNPFNPSLFTQKWDI